MSENYGKPTSAEPAGDSNDDPTCKHCGWSIKQVPGGDGSIWIHRDGYRACEAQQRARFLVESILKLSDHLAPIIRAHLDNLHMDTPPEQELVDNILLLVEPWYDKVLTLRAMSHVS